MRDSLENLLSSSSKILKTSSSEILVLSKIPLLIDAYVHESNWKRPEITSLESEFESALKIFDSKVNKGPTDSLNIGDSFTNTLKPVIERKLLAKREILIFLRHLA